MVDRLSRVFIEKVDRLIDEGFVCYEELRLILINA